MHLAWLCAPSLPPQDGVILPQLKLSVLTARIQRGDGVMTAE